MKTFCMLVNAETPLSAERRSNIDANNFILSFGFIFFMISSENPRVNRKTCNLCSKNDHAYTVLLILVSVTCGSKVVDRRQTNTQTSDAMDPKS